ncbi:sugar nucleotide-binding protein [Candidatus Pseudothioglobus singularis]|nr:sugar nucleotide-binding protein [Candidatus Pseudothioglobus singularis]
MKTKLKKALILGGSGMLGRDIVAIFSKKFIIKSTHFLNPTYEDSIFFDVQKNPELLNKLISEFKPDIIVNCIAIVALNYCEEEPSICKRINGGFCGSIVQAVKDAGLEDRCCLMHISTDSIYCEKNINNHSYKETDNLCSNNMYSRSKIIGERAYSNYNGRKLLIRTAIYGSKSKPGKGLLNWIVSSIKSNNAITGWTNVFFSPISTYRLSLILLDLLESNASGVFNVGSEDYCSKYEFIQQVINNFGSKCKFKPEIYKNNEDRCFRPLSTILDVNKVQAYTKNVRSWSEDLSIYLSKNY